MKKWSIVLSFLLFFTSIHPKALNSEQAYRALCDQVVAKYRQCYDWCEENQESIYKTLGVIALIYTGWWYNRTYANPFDKSIALNASHCSGCATTYNGAEVVQIKVKNQCDADGGGAASCGYHSMRNAEEISQALTRHIKNLNERIESGNDIPNLFGENGEWRQVVRERRAHADDSAEWLHSGEIEHIMRYKIQPRYNFDCIDDMTIIGHTGVPVRADRPEEASGDYITPAIKEALKKDGEYIHQFFICTASTTGEGSADSMNNKGHWFVVILHKAANGVRRFIIADSLNHRRVDDWRVKKLIDALS